MNRFVAICGGVIGSILIWQEFIPKLWSLSILGVFCFLIIILSEEARSFLEDKFSWLASHLFEVFIDK